VEIVEAVGAVVVDVAVFGIDVEVVGTAVEVVVVEIAVEVVVGIVGAVGKQIVDCVVVVEDTPNAVADDN